MAPKHQEIIVVHTAMDREKDAIGLYLKFAAAVKDVKAKNVLIHLASDEVGHLDKLEHHLTSVLSGKRGLLAVSDLADAMAARLTEGSRLVFPTEGELARADEIRILELALELELEANRRYIELAGSGDEDTARIFLSLAKEEETHAKILRAEIDAIGQNGFWFDIQEFTMEQ
jgi:rubrerythrin